MKKILIIEDDQVVANVYRNKLVLDGYKVEVALDGENGLKMMQTFEPDLVVLDLMLPNISGVDVIKQIRAALDFAKTPIIVLSNTYLSNVIQEAWRAGASKCLSKASCSPKDFIEVVRQTIGDSGAMRSAGQVSSASPNAAMARPGGLTGASDAEFQADLKKTFLENIPATIHSLRSSLKELIKSDSEDARLKQIYELYRRIHAVNGNAGVAGLVQIAHMSSALEALLKEIYEKPRNINQSSLRTVAAAVDFLGILFEQSKLSTRQEVLVSKILVVDDEAISRRAIVYALEKAQLKSVSVDSSEEALKLLAQNDFDMVFLDVDMPGMNGYELCARLRAMPHHNKTPVVFVTALTDFGNRTSSTMAGGNDFIGKPFLFIELTVKALIYVMRARLAARPMS